MPPGADKIISYDPPGAIGLQDPDPIVLLRFNEPTAADPPADSAGTLLDMGITTGLAATTVVPGITGNARHFDAGISSGLIAKDRVPGTSMITRDCTIQAIAKWVAADQVAYGTPGKMITRGFGFFSGGASETIAFQIMFFFDDGAPIPAPLPAGQGRIVWLWDTVGGGGFLPDPGAVFVSPLGFTLFTMTRRWISPTSVVLRYYIGDTFLGETTSIYGNIGGGTTGTMQIGTGNQGGTVFGATFCGDIDEIMVVDREMSQQEIENTWLRLTKYQPLGTQLFLAMHDDGFPMPNDPSSDMQLDTRMIGHALGYAASTIENLRNNHLPGRAYGTTLEQWEQAVSVTPKPAQSLDQRRLRVQARLQQRNGVSPTGISEAIGDLVDTAVSNLQYIAFDNTWLDDFTTLNLLRWDLTPTACATAASGKLHFAPGAGTFTALTGGWLTAAATVSRSSEDATFSGEHALAKLVMTTPQSGQEAGVFFSNRIANNHLLLGIRDNAGTFQVVTEPFLNGVSQGVVVQGVVTGSPVTVWLHLYQDAGTTGWIAAWSIASRTAGYTTSPPITFPGMVHWSGCYFRSTGAIGAAVADFEDFTLRTPDGNRTLVAYVYRDPALGGNPDLDAAESVIQAIRHAYTEVHLITSKVFRADLDPTDSVPMGGI